MKASMMLPVACMLISVMIGQYFIFHHSRMLKAREHLDWLLEQIAENEKVFSDETADSARRKEAAKTIRVYRKEYNELLLGLQSHCSSGIKWIIGKMLKFSEREVLQ